MILDSFVFSVQMKREEFVLKGRVKRTQTTLDQEMVQDFADADMINYLVLREPNRPLNSRKVSGKLATFL